MLNYYLQSHESEGERIMLCDGDCGNCYNEIDMNYTCDGDNLCDKCMFSFMVKKEREEHQP